MGQHLGVSENKRALTEIVQQQGGQHIRAPGDPDRPLAEVSHVGVDALGAGDGKHHRAQRQKPGNAIVDEKSQRVRGIDCLENGWSARDVHHTQQCQHGEPQHRDRPEQSADAGGALLLNDEKQYDDGNGDRNDERLETRRCNLQTLDRRKYRNRRCDHAVAVEHRRTEQPERHEEPACARAALCGAQYQREQGHHAALAAVVRPHHEHDVLERYHDYQRPEDQRQHAEDIGVRRGHSVAAAERFLHRVQRAGADVAEYHADRGDRQRECARLRVVLPGGAHRVWGEKGFGKHRRRQPRCHGCPAPRCPHPVSSGPGRGAGLF